MVSRISRFEYIVTDSELEALVLECNLIKEHRPKYNTMLKDDKTYPFIKVTVAEDYPRILFSRTMKKDKNKYFGPYTSAGAVKDTIELLRKIYKIRSCQRSLPREGIYTYIYSKSAPVCTITSSSARRPARAMCPKKSIGEWCSRRWISSQAIMSPF